MWLQDDPSPLGAVLADAVEHRFGRLHGAAPGAPSVRAETAALALMMALATRSGFAVMGKVFHPSGSNWTPGLPRR